MPFPVDNFYGGNPGRPVRLAMDVGSILLGETGEFRSLKHSKLLPGEGPAAGPEVAAGLAIHPGASGVSWSLTTHHPVYYHQNNAENHDFQWYK